MLFDFFPKALASVASFLFPLFASYKALNSSDPAQLTPWLMYWVVLSCVVLVESWTDWILVWIPFYHYFRLFFLLYLVLPQTQGARVLYQTHLHPWLTEHESRIDEFIGSAHARLRSAGLHYLKQAISYLRTALGLPNSEPTPSAAPSASSAANAQSYTQALLARFILPNARWPGGAAGATNAASPAASAGTVPSTGADFYNLLAGAVNALGTATGAAGAAGGVAAGAAASALGRGILRGNTTTTSSAGTSDLSSSGLVPAHVGDADRASFLATQRDRLRTLLSALEREAAQLEEEQENEGSGSGSPLSRPLSGASGLSKSRSEADFEKIDAESGAEEEKPVRRKNASNYKGASPGQGPGAGKRTSSGSWMPWGWGGSPAAGDSTDTAAEAADDTTAKSSSVEK